VARERDFRNALKDALVQTGAFTNVTLTGLPETYGEGSSDLAAAAIQPGSTRMTTGWDASPDGGRNFMCQLLVTVLARHSDAELCDDLAEQLVEFVRNAVDGLAIVPGFNEPQKTMVTGWTWQPRAAPERRIAITVTYDYLQDGWNSADTSQ
jgi:hypothetical protein